MVSAFTHPVEEAYDLTPKISIDYGIMEKIDRAAVVPFEVTRNDVGNSYALYGAIPKNGDQNAGRREHIGINSRNNLIISDRLVATVGVSDLVIIETKDAVLVASRSEAQ